MQCPACHAEITGAAVFCHQCGARLNDDESLLRHASSSNVSRQSTEAAESVERQSPDEIPQSVASQIQAAAQRNRSADDDREDELWQGGFSGKAMVGPWCAGALVSAGLLIFGIWRVGTWTGWGYLFLMLLVVWVVPLLLLAYRKLNVGYRLTTQRLFHERGILRRVTDRIEVIDMDDITYSQGMLERMLGVGSIQVVSSDKTHPEFWIRGIDDVKRVATLMDDARRKERMRRGLHIEAV